MMKEKNICHQGIVVKCKDDCVLVSIESKSACASCHTKSMCNLNEVQEKIIEVQHANPSNYKPGDLVTVNMARSMGNKALWLGYLLPFLIVMVSLFVFSYLSGSELQAGLISLLLLIPYYLILYKMRNKLKNTFRFEIE
jgi:positive regulator of sigma E activity